MKIGVTPYNLCLKWEHPKEIQKLLLKADPDIDPDALLELKYGPAATLYLLLRRSSSVVKPDEKDMDLLLYEQEQNSDSMEKDMQKNTLHNSHSNHNIYDSVSGSVEGSSFQSQEPIPSSLESEHSKEIQQQEQQQEQNATSQIDFNANSDGSTSTKITFEFPAVISTDPIVIRKNVRFINNESEYLTTECSENITPCITTNMNTSNNIYESICEKEMTKEQSPISVSENAM